MVSVIMSCYKESEDILRESIESILTQSYQEFEFIIVLDNPQNILHLRILEEYSELDRRIIYIVNNKNLGIANSLNIALKMAKGTYICRMDADDISDAHRIEWQKNYLEFQEYDLIGGLITVIDEHGEYRYQVNRLPDNPATINKLLCYNQCIPHPCWFGRKRVFEELNGYRDIAFCEDYDFTLRVAMAGYKISNIDRHVVKYRIMKNGISKSNLYEQYLYSKYLTRCYKHQQIADMESAISYVETHRNASAKNRYLKASYLLDEMISCWESRNYFTFISKGVQLCFCSATYYGKIFRYIRISLG